MHAYLLALYLLATPPTFDVVAIKPSADTAFRMSTSVDLRHGTLHGQGVSLRRILATAYGVDESRIIAPKWLDNTHFDLYGKSPKDVPDNQLKPMLQALLKDRFQLKEHHEERELPIYNLVVAKTGVKMAVVPKESPADSLVRGYPMMRGTGEVAMLAQMLSGVVGRPVIDRTGLTDQYNFNLGFAPLVPKPGAATEDAPPDLFTAVQQQLGLKLEPSKANLDVVIVDQINRTPSEN